MDARFRPRVVAHSKGYGVCSFVRAGDANTRGLRTLGVRLRPLHTRRRGGVFLGWQIRKKKGFNLMALWTKTTHCCTLLIGDKCPATQNTIFFMSSSIPERESNAKKKGFRCIANIVWKKMGPVICTTTHTFQASGVGV